MSNCINVIKMSIKHNKKGFVIDNNSKNMSIIKEFLKIKVIKFVIIREKLIIGYINYDKYDKPIFSNIINLFKPSNKKYISVNELKKIIEKHNWIFILSTNKGFINSYEALKINSGGLLIAQLWN